MATDGEAPTTGAAAGYVDIYVLPVPAQHLDIYRRQAEAFGKVAKEYGALSYREFRGDDLGEGLAAPEGQEMTAAAAEFASRAHRDEVMAKVMDDPRVKDQLEGDQVADMAQMRYGGFAAFVAA